MSTAELIYLGQLHAPPLSVIFSHHAGSVVEISKEMAASTCIKSPCPTLLLGSAQPSQKGPGDEARTGPRHLSALFSTRIMVGKDGGQGMCKERVPGPSPGGARS